MALFLAGAQIVGRDCCSLSFFIACLPLQVAPVADDNSLLIVILMSELATLRTAKAALDEGLIAPEDFDTIKLAFLRAQQIKAGLDAGFIREEDYTKTKDAFLCALDFRVLNVNAPLAGANGAALANKQGPAPVAVKPPGLAAAPAAAAAAPTPSSPAPVARTIASSQLPRTGSDKQPARAESPVSSVAPSSSAFSAIPTDLPKTRINPALAGKVTRHSSELSGAWCKQAVATHHHSVPDLAEDQVHVGYLSQRGLRRALQLHQDALCSKHPWGRSQLLVYMIQFLPG